MARRPWVRWVRWAIGLLLVGWLTSLSAVLAWALEDDAEHADAIIVMGAAQYQGKPSPVLRSRLDHAVALWQLGLAKRMVLTGGFGTGDTLSEAGVSRHYVMSRGVPDTAILLESMGRTSSQSMRSAIELMHTQQLQTAIVVSDPFHMLRLEIIGRRYGIEPLTSPALPSRAGSRIWNHWSFLLAESIKAPVALVLDW
ncbi:MAG: YdcF family protein [bacterium]